MSDADLIVIGAGPWGLMSAWRAARAGATVILIDDGGTPAGHVAAGMLGPWSEAEHRSGAMHALMVRSSREWPRMVDELHEDSDADVGYVSSGTLLVATRPEQIGPLQAHGSTIADLDEPPRWESGRELREREPALGTHIAGGFNMADEHQVDPRRAMAALRTACSTRGVQTLDDAAVALTLSAGKVTGVATHGGRMLTASRTALAAGWNAGALSDRVPLRPVKGQILRLGTPDGSAPPLHRVVRSGEAYVAPRPHGEVVVGGTVEETSDTAVEAGAVQRLLEEALLTVPSLRDLEFREAAAGLRPATPDGLPAIGMDHNDGLIFATGAFRHGVLLAPVAGEAVAALATGIRPDSELTPFHPGRFEATP